MASRRSSPLPRIPSGPRPLLASGSSAQISAAEAEARLHDWIATTYADPLAFVLGGYPWPIKGEFGPDVWQRELLVELGRQVAGRGFDGQAPVLPIRVAVSSGHGIGKSTLIAWIVDWLMSTRPGCRGTLTANTFEQLEKRTWAAVREWTARCITTHWFELNTQIMYRKGFRSTWFCAPQSCAEENSEAFAGQQAKGSTSFYLNDEDSAVPDKIHEVEEGGLGTGESMQFLFGNPTRNTGAFHRVAFGDRRDRYTVRIIDSRDCKFPNKALIAEYLADYGEDSDFFRVRVRGLPPRASELQFIDLERIWQAQRRPAMAWKDEPLIAGVDVSGGGAAWNVVRFRRGLDARTIPPIRIPGEATRHDRSAFASILANILADKSPARRIAMMFVDAGYGAAYVERLKSMGYGNVMEVNFGSTHNPDEAHCANQRAYMWDRLKEWLSTGSIPPQDVRLEQDLSGPGYHRSATNKLVIESKESMQKRGVASPDDGDALALTFAAPIQAQLGLGDLRPSGGNWQC